MHFHTQDYDRDNYSSNAGAEDVPPRVTAQTASSREVSTADRRSSPNVSVSVETRRTSPYDDVEPRRSADLARRRSSASGGGGRTTVEIGRASMSGETVEETARRMSTTGRRESMTGRRGSASGQTGQTRIEIGRASSGETVEDTARRMSTTGRRASASGTFLLILFDPILISEFTNMSSQVKFIEYTLAAKS